jgi:hypothetical protein
MKDLHNPLIPANAGTQIAECGLGGFHRVADLKWVPAFAGMSGV